MKIKQLGNAFVELFYPRLCSACHNPLQHTEKQICIYCTVALPRIQSNRISSSQVKALFDGRVELKQAYSWLFFRKKGITQRLMHELKYNGNQALGETLGFMYGVDLQGYVDFILPDLFCSVPLHPQKLKSRGYNQSDAIALGMSKALNIQFDASLLKRTIHSGSQTHLKRYERWQNAQAQFELTRTDGLEGLHVAIVDDVITTGSTLEACAEKLLNAKVNSVSVFSLCMAIN